MSPEDCRSVAEYASRSMELINQTLFACLLVPEVVRIAEAIKHRHDLSLDEKKAQAMDAVRSHAKELKERHPQLAELVDAYVAFDDSEREVSR